MKIILQERSIIHFKAQRDVLSQVVNSSRVDMCAPPSYNYLNKSLDRNERTALCVLKGSMTVEAAFVLPLFLIILLAFFSFFSQYASAAEAKVLAAAEAKMLGAAMGNFSKEEGADVTIYKVKKIEKIWINPFEKKDYIIQKAVCRGWIGFTQLQDSEIYVYVTAEGEVYHLYADCTHLDLSVRRVTKAVATISKNEYGERYSECELCKGPFGILVYITSEGNRYHSERNCSGLKRTIRQIPLSEVGNRRGCIRCTSREE